MKSLARQRYYGTHQSTWLWLDLESSSPEFCARAERKLSAVLSRIPEPRDTHSDPTDISFGETQGRVSSPEEWKSVSSSLTDVITTWLRCKLQEQKKGRVIADTVPDFRKRIYPQIPKFSGKHFHSNFNAPHLIPLPCAELVVGWMLQYCWTFRCLIWRVLRKAVDEL